jgi:hypothetical protein
MIKRYYIYLNEKQKIIFRMRNIITFMLEKKKSRMRNIVISLKEIKLRNIELLLYFFEKSIVNESRFLNACNRIHNCQNDDSKTIKKKKKNTFSKT